MSVRQMVVGDDEVEAEAARGFSFSEGAHAGVDRDDDADTVGVSRFKDARLHAVAVTEAMGNVKADVTTEHFDRGFEQDDSDRAINVVVAIKENGLARGDGAFEAINGGRHAEHEKGIVEVRRLGIEEGESLSGGVDAARDEQLGENKRQTRFAGERGGCFGVWLGEDPTLGRQSARWSGAGRRSGGAGAWGPGGAG